MKILFGLLAYINNRSSIIFFYVNLVFRKFTSEEKIYYFKLIILNRIYDNTICILLKTQNSKR